jgi:5-methylcytosine-specific restriction endonuclease McrA
MAAAKPKRGVKNRAGGTLTEAQHWSKIVSALRKTWQYYPSRKIALLQVRRVVTGQRHRFEYPCALCSEWFKEKEVQVDHIIPAGSIRTDAQGYLDRMFCEPKDLQVLCKPCHKLKTAEERNR